MQINIDFSSSVFNLSIFLIELIFSGKVIRGKGRFVLSGRRKLSLLFLEFWKFRFRKPRNLSVKREPRWGIKIVCLSSARARGREDRSMTAVNSKTASGVEERDFIRDRSRKSGKYFRYVTLGSLTILAGKILAVIYREATLAEGRTEARCWPIRGPVSVSLSPSLSEPEHNG